MKTIVADLKFNFRFSWHLSKFSYRLPTLMSRHAPLLAAITAHFKSGVTGEAKTWPMILERAGLKHILEIGCGARPDLSNYLATQLPDSIQLTALNPYGVRNLNKRVAFIRGEAADLPALAPQERFDLIISNGVYSLRQLQSEKYDLINNGHLIIQSSLAALSDHPLAAVIFNAFFGDHLFLFREEFNNLGQVVFWRKFSSILPDLGRTVVLMREKGSK